MINHNIKFMLSNLLLLYDGKNVEVSSYLTSFANYDVNGKRV